MAEAAERGWTVTDMKQDWKVAGLSAGEVTHRSRAEPFRRVANLRRIHGGCVFSGTARCHTSVTPLPQRKFAQSALPSVCRMTRRRS
jgi:hypothetical protein